MPDTDMLTSRGQREGRQSNVTRVAGKGLRGSTRLHMTPQKAAPDSIRCTHLLLGRSTVLRRAGNKWTPNCKSGSIKGSHVLNWPRELMTKVHSETTPGVVVLKSTNFVLTVHTNTSWDHVAVRRARCHRSDGRPQRVALSTPEKIDTLRPSRLHGCRPVSSDLDPGRYCAAAPPVPTTGPVAVCGCGPLGGPRVTDARPLMKRARLVVT